MSQCNYLPQVLAFHAFKNMNLHFIYQNEEVLLSTHFNISLYNTKFKCHQSLKPISLHLFIQYVQEKKLENSL